MKKALTKRIVVPVVPVVVTQHPRCLYERRNLWKSLASHD